MTHSLPKIINVKYEVFTQDELLKYEEKILSNERINEHDVSRFFFDFPKFLTVGGYSQIAREVVLYKGKEHVYRVDFFRRQIGSDYWDFVELKSPKTPFIIRKGNHWKFSAEIEAGINQADDYKDLLESDMNRLYLEQRTGIKAYRPKLLLVGGRSKDSVDPDELKRLQSRYNTTDIRSYDDIYQFAKECYKTNLIAIPCMQNWHIDSPNTTIPIEEKTRIIHSPSGIIVQYPCQKCGYKETYCNWEYTTDYDQWYDHFYHLCVKCGHKESKHLTTGYDLQEELSDPQSCPICSRNLIS